MAATWDSGNKDAGVSLSGGNLVASWASGSWQNVKANFSKTSGKWYWEVTATDSTSTPRCGFFASTGAWSNPFDNGSAGYGFGADGRGDCVNNGSITYIGSDNWDTGETVGFALDADLGKMWVYQAGAWLNGGNPAAGTGAMWDIADGTQIFPIASVQGSTSVVTANFGATAFANTPPSGFSGPDSPISVSVFDSVTVTDFPGYPPDMVFVSESVSLSLSALTVILSSPFDSVTVSEGISLSVGLSISVFDSVTVSENFDKVFVIPFSVFDEIIVSENTTTIIPELVPSVFETVVISEDVSLTIPILFVSVSELVTVSEESQVSYSLPSPVVDSVTVSEDIHLLLLIPLSVSDSVIVSSEDISLSIPLPVFTFDSVVISENLQFTGISSEDGSELVTVTDIPEILIYNYILEIYDSVTISENLQLVGISSEDESELVTVSEDVSIVVLTAVSVYESIIITEGAFTSDTTIWVYEPQQYAPRGSILLDRIDGSVSPWEGLRAGGGL